MARAAIASPKSAMAMSSLDEDNIKALRQLVLRSMFWRPEYYQTTSAWIEHLPFAFWLVEAQQPSSFVELGCHYGVSYFAFCQAINRLTLDAQAYAVDTWKGDEHAGFYGKEVFEDVRSHNDRNYSGFSQLIRSSFDKAATHFSDGSIDLLHIDGLHTYDAVLHDFEIWLPKMSKRGIILFHDTNVRERGFGVYRLFEELRERYPSFAFIHGHGLGVIGVGEEQTDLLKRLYAADRNAKTRQAIQEAFARLGRACADARESGKQKGLVQGLRQQLSDEKSSTGGKDIELESQATALNDADAKLRSAEQTIEELREQLQRANRKDETIAKLRSELDGFQGLNTENARTADLLKAQAEELKIAQTQLADHRLLIHRHIAERDQAVLKLAARQLEATRLKLVIEKKSTQLREAVSENGNVKAAFNDRNQQHERLSGEVTLLKELLGDQARKQEEAAAENAALRKALEQLTASHQDLAAANTAINSSLEELTAEFIQERDNFIEKDELIQAELDEGAANYSSLMAAKEDLARQLEEASQTLSDAHAHAQADIATLTGQLEAAAKSADLMSISIDELQRSLDFTTSDRDILQADLSTSRRELGILAAQIKISAAEAEGYQAQLAELRRDFETPLFKRFVYRLRPENPGRRIKRLVSTSGLFDEDWYLARNPDVAAAGVDALGHYLEHGWHEGRNPSELFSVKDYLAANPDVEAARLEPLLHYITRGRIERRPAWTVTE